MNDAGDVTIKWTSPDPKDRLAEPVELEVRARQIPGEHRAAPPGIEFDIILDGTPITLTPEQAQFVVNALCLYGISTAWEKRRG